MLFTNLTYLAVKMPVGKSIVANRDWLIVTVLQATACKIRSKKVWVYRVVNTWNSLPKCVASANTTNTFKTRLDRPKFWHNQDIIYNSRA